jgi:hypothetical protein
MIMEATVVAPLADATKWVGLPTVAPLPGALTVTPAKQAVAAKIKVRIDISLRTIFSTP